MDRYSLNRPLEPANPIIESLTPRLHLRQWQAEDFAPFAALNADPEVMAYFPKPLSRQESDVIATRCQHEIAAQGWGFWALELRESGEFIGFTGLHRPSSLLPFAPCVEIGWRLARRFWGQGLATEAARAALDVGFNRLQLDEIVSFATAGNLRSQKVMQRLGMRERPDEAFEHPAIEAGHPLRAHCLYRLNRETFNASAH